MNVYLLFLMFTSVIGSLPKLFLKSISSQNVIKSRNVTRISDCYFECWDDTEYECCAVGFLPSKMNKQNKQQVLCYFIKCSKEVSGDEGIMLEVFVSILKNIVEVLYEQMPSPQTSLF